MISNQKLNEKVSQLFIRERKINISIVCFVFVFFFIKSYFAVPQDIRLNCTHFFLIKALNKQEL